jgi:hypothetical protein
MGAGLELLQHEDILTAIQPRGHMRGVMAPLRRGPAVLGERT